MTATPIPIDAREQLARADAADAILKHPLIAEALDAYEKELTAAWKNSHAADREGREKIHYLLRAQQEFRAHLVRTITTGKLIRAKVPTQSAIGRTADSLRKMVRR